MSDSTKNPFESPKTSMDEIKSSTATGELTQLMQSYLNESSPWIRFIGILGYIGSGFIILIGISMSVGFSVFSSTFDSVEGFSGFMGAGLGLIYVIIGIVMFFPAHFVFKYGSGIKRYKQSGLNKDLESAFKFNKLIWKFLGIIYIIYLSLIPIMIIISFIFGIASAL